MSQLYCTIFLIIRGTLHVGMVIDRQGVGQVLKTIAFIHLLQFSHMQLIYPQCHPDNPQLEQ